MKHSNQNEKSKYSIWMNTIWMMLPAGLLVICGIFLLGEFFNFHNIWLDISQPAINWGRVTIEIAICFILGVIMVFLHIRASAEHKETENSLKQYRFMVESVHDVIFYKDLESRYIIANNKTLEAFGLSLEEVVGKNDYEIMQDKDEARKNVEDDRDVFKRSVSKTITKHMTGADGKEYWFHAIKIPCYDKNGEVSGLIGIARDVTNSMKIEQALKKTQEAFHGFMESATDCFLLFDAGLNLVEINKAGLNISLKEGKKEDLIGKNIIELAPNIKETGRYDKYMKVVQTGEPLFIEEITIHPKFANIIFSIRAFKVDEGLGLIATDITEQKRLKDQLFQAQKLESIGKLAAGVAHDMNNVLASIASFAQSTQLDIDESFDAYQNLGEIMKVVKRGKSLTQNLLGFARKAHYNIKPTDCTAAVLDMETILKHTLPKSISISVEMAKGLPNIMIDGMQFLQTLINICMNAADAMPDGGELTISGSEIYVDEKFIDLHIGIKKGAYILLKIQDTGTGIEKEILSKVFDPFFTTKPLGKGTGLGLSMAYGLMKTIGGDISIYSEKGTGTCVNLYLPTTDKAVEVEEIIEKKHDKKVQIKVVLLADDEEIILKPMAQLMVMLGYRVITARDGEEAVRQFQKNSEIIDVVILDIMMPNMEGPEALAKIFELKPKIPVIVTSGFSINGTARKMLDMGALHFLQKPFDFAELQEILTTINVRDE